MEEVVEADREYKRVTEKSDWHTRVSDSVTQKERMWVRKG